MKDLIESLQIFLKYDNPEWPTHCEHDVMHVAIDPKLISDEDKKRLEELSWFEDEWEGFSSFRFGSC